MVAHQAAQYRTLASLSRVNLLHELQQHGSRTVAELAEATQLHPNTAREHLHRLIDAGFVDSETIPSTTRGRPTIRYRAARGAESPSRRAWLASSEQRSALVRRLLPLSEVTAERTELERQLDVLDDHMEQCGFDADIQHSGTQMTMHDCPFGDLAADNPQVCAVHFTLIQDALIAGGGPLRAHELHPFSTPRTCSVDLGAPLPTDV